MDYLTFTVLATAYPRAPVRDCDSDLWHAGCLLWFVEHSASSARHRDNIRYSSDIREGCFKDNCPNRKDKCPNQKFDLSSEAAWTCSPSP